MARADEEGPPSPGLILRRVALDQYELQRFHAVFHAIVWPNWNCVEWLYLCFFGSWPMAGKPTGMLPGIPPGIPPGVIPRDMPAIC